MSLSVVIPTLNCREMVEAHLQTMRPWLSLVDEIVVVDSYSDDGTPELIEKNLRHPKLRVMRHPRGLYQSWNFGIQQTMGDWIYISTVGDGISKKLLQHLRSVGEELECDVVASKPQFVTVDGRPMDQVVWPIDHILRSMPSRKALRLSGVEAFLYALFSLPCAVLGSSASNLYRGAHLRARPFPTTFGTIGDTAWTLEYGLTTRYGFTPESGSFFRFHPKAYSPSEYEVHDRQSKLLGLAEETLSQPDHPPEVAAMIERTRVREILRSLIARASGQFAKSA